MDKITIVSTGNGDATGMHKMTGDITKIAAQVPALFEALSGMPMSDLLSKVRKIGDKAAGGARRVGHGGGAARERASEGSRSIAGAV